MNKRIDLLVRYTSEKEFNCKICRKTLKPDYIVEKAFYTFLFMGFFPGKTEVYRLCPNCKTRLKINPAEHEFREVIERVSSTRKLKYVFGWVVILLISVGVAVLMSYEL